MGFYKYTGFGSRTMSEGDLASLDLDVEGGVSFDEHNGYTLELPDEVAERLRLMGEPLVQVDGLDHSAEAEATADDENQPVDPGDGPDAETVDSSPSAGEGTATSGTRARGNAGTRSGGSTG